MEKFTDNLLLYIKGLAMGAADVVPGVSGGTIAFVTGIYIELINTIKSLNLRALQTLKSEGIGAAWRFINGRFIVILLAGILTSLFSLAQVMQYLLVEHPLPLWSFFTGLIVASVVYLLRQNPLRSTYEKLIFFVGIGIAWNFNSSASGFGRNRSYHVSSGIHCPMCNDFTRDIWLLYSCAVGPLSCIHRCDCQSAD